MGDAEYLIKREQQELEAALRASDARVRQVHLELADAYTFRVNQTKRLERRAELTPEAD
jgi:predicted nucleic acid-binding protein